MTVSDLLLDVLHRHGVTHLFGIPGDAINDITDALRRRDGIHFVQVRHEEAGAFAASAQGKVTGRLAACLGTAGPGAIHLLNGLYDAKLDHAPVVAVTGQVETGSIGTSYHQEVRLERLFADVAVYSQTVVTERQLPDVFLEACHAALARRGVAHVSLPADLSGCKAKKYDGSAAGFALPLPAAPPDADLDAAAELIDRSERVAILAGIGCRDAADALRNFADKVGAPIIRSLRGKEVIDDDDPMCIGGLGLLGGSPAVKAVESCDLLIMAGTDFPYRGFYPRNAKAIQIDIDPTQIGKRHRVDIALAAHARPTLERLMQKCRARDDRRFLRRMQERMQKSLRELKAAEAADDEPIQPPRLMAALGDVAPSGAVFTCDTGTATAWTARHLRLRQGQRYTLSGGLASMGFALPAAIGAQLAYPNARVFAVAGDGGFTMTMADFLTAVRYELPILVVVLNNSKLAFITMEQEVKGLPDFGTGLNNPRFADIATACGGLGYRIEKPAALAPTLTEALESKRPAIVDVVVDPDQLVMPPKIKAGDAAGYGLAKLRETFA